MSFQTSSEKPSAKRADYFHQKGARKKLLQKDSKPMPHILLGRLRTVVAFPELPSTTQGVQLGNKFESCNTEAKTPFDPDG